MKQEKKNSRVRLILVMIVLLAALLAAIFLTDPGGEKTESIQAVMKDAVLHEDNQMAFLGMRVNPSVISDWVVTGLLLVVAALLRIFAIPHFKLVPGKADSVAGVQLLPALGAGLAVDGDHTLAYDELRLAACTDERGKLQKRVELDKFSCYSYFFHNY